MTGSFGDRNFFSLWRFRSNCSPLYTEHQKIINFFLISRKLNHLVENDYFLAVYSLYTTVYAPHDNVFSAENLYLSSDGDYLVT